MSLTAGSNLSHFRLIEPLGEGGMGVVWRATVLVHEEQHRGDGERRDRQCECVRASATLTTPWSMTARALATDPRGASGDGIAAPIVMPALRCGTRGAPAGPRPGSRPEPAACLRPASSRTASSPAPALRDHRVRTASPASLAALPGTLRPLRVPRARSRGALRAHARPAARGGAPGGGPVPGLWSARARVGQHTLRITIDAARWTRSPSPGDIIPSRARSSRS